MQVDSALDIADKNGKKIQTFDLSYFNGRGYFDFDASQKYSVFQPLLRTFRIPTSDTGTIIPWKLKGLSDESIKLPTKLDNPLKTKLKWIHNSKVAVEFLSLKGAA